MRQKIQNEAAQRDDPDGRQEQNERLSSWSEATLDMQVSYRLIQRACGQIEHGWTNREVLADDLEPLAEVEGVTLIRNRRAVR